MAEQIVRKDCRERVAFDLAMTIANHEAGLHEGLQQDRKWWLKLYAQCHKAVISGWKSEDALSGG